MVRDRTRHGVGRHAQRLEDLRLGAAAATVVAAPCRALPWPQACLRHGPAVTPDDSSRPAPRVRRRAAIVMVFCTSFTLAIAQRISPASRFTRLFGTMPVSVARPFSQRTSTSLVPA